MDAQECLQILRDVKDVAFATVDENGMPRVRIIDVMLVEKEKLYFCTARGKDFYRQLTEKPHTEITGMNSEYQRVPDGAPFGESKETGRPERMDRPDF